jgi:hypothetical protein
MNFGFSHLIVNGCSYTSCVGLENPDEDGWPKLLANRLGVPLINLAEPGSGNDRLFRTTVDHVYNNPLPNPLYLLAFSHSSRREEYLGHSKKDYYNLHLNHAAQTELERILITEYNQIEYSKTKLRYWVTIVNTLKANNISYLTTDFMPDFELNPRNYSPDLYDAVNTDINRIEDFFRLCDGLPKLPCGHETLTTMKIIAEYAYKEIEKRWH